MINLTEEEIQKYKNNVKQVLVLRKDLNMRKGKMISQGAHASERAVFSQGYIDEKQRNFIIPLRDDEDNLTPLGYWLSTNFKKITTSVNSEQELIDIYNKAKERNIPCVLIEDSGLTEFNGVVTKTAIAIGPALNERFIDLTDNLPLL